MLYPLSYGGRPSTTLAHRRSGSPGPLDGLMIATCGCPLLIHQQRTPAERDHQQRTRADGDHSWIGTGDRRFLAFGGADSSPGARPVCARRRVRCWRSPSGRSDAPPAGCRTVAGAGAPSTAGATAPLGVRWRRKGCDGRSTRDVARSGRPAAGVALWTLRKPAERWALGGTVERLIVAPAATGSRDQGGTRSGRPPGRGIRSGRRPATRARNTQRATPRRLGARGDPRPVGHGGPPRPAGCGTRTPAPPAR